MIAPDVIRIDLDAQSGSRWNFDCVILQTQRRGGAFDRDTFIAFEFDMGTWAWPTPDGACTRSPILPKCAVDTFSLSHAPSDLILTSE